MIKENFDLGKISWFRVGGKASVFFKPSNKKDLTEFLKNNTKQITVIGNLSNTLIRDGGIDGACIKLGSGFTEFEVNGEEIKVGGAMLDKTFAVKAMEEEIGGFEFLHTIPGNIGGGVKMNCGCFGGEIKDVFISLEGVDFEGNSLILRKDDIAFDYRKTNIPENIIITSVILKGFAQTKSQILETMKRNEKQRNNTQPVSGKTCGSTFKNPVGGKAWDLLIKSGANNLRIGGASFSPIHANFIINDGTATAKDIEELGEEARKLVLEKFGISLEWEIKIIGKP